MLKRSAHARRSEHGVALLSAIALMVIGALIIGAVMATVMQTRDRARDDVDKSIGSGPAEEGVRAYLAALTAGEIGEQTGYAFSRAALVRTVREQNPSAGMCTSPSQPLCLVQNKDTAFKFVDTALVDAADQLTVRRRVGNGAYRFWQMLAVSPPRYGVQVAGGGVSSPGGAPIVYIRGWQGRDVPSVNDRIRPVVLAARVRPSVFSDYQLLTDGKVYLGDGINVNGRVHTNGLDQSFFDQYRTLVNAITVTGATCSNTASLSTATGEIGPDNILKGAIPGSCNVASRLFPNTKEHLSLLRTTEAGRLASKLCPSTKDLNIQCFEKTGQQPFRVTLRGDGRISIVGEPSVDANNYSLTDSTLTAGAVLVFNRSVEVSGQLGSDARATIFAANLKSEPVAETPSIRFVTDNVGAKPGSKNTVGFVAEGDVIADQARSCPSNIRAAMVAQGGMLSLDPRYRGAYIPNAPVCSQGAGLKLDGSITGHLPPYLTVFVTQAGAEVATAGYATRTYEYDPWLYHNPPPLFPASEKWQVLSSTNADLTCFTGDPAGIPTLIDRTGCR